jgi:hypothetical protein
LITNGPVNSSGEIHLASAVSESATSNRRAWVTSPVSGRSIPSNWSVCPLRVSTVLRSGGLTTDDSGSSSGWPVAGTSVRNTVVASNCSGAGAVSGTSTGLLPKPGWSAKTRSFQLMFCRMM